ncbi:hypothetical protein [Algoriphagus kandeliae]|nr:hypothetical protein [Algoriphagus kandeliae]
MNFKLISLAIEGIDFLIDKIKIKGGGRILENDVELSTANI